MGIPGPTDGAQLLVPFPPWRLAPAGHCLKPWPHPITCRSFLRALLFGGCATNGQAQALTPCVSPPLSGPSGQSRCISVLEASDLKTETWSTCARAGQDPGRVAWDGRTFLDGPSVFSGRVPAVRSRPRESTTGCW